MRKILRDLTSLDEARQILDSLPVNCGVEHVSLERADGRILAEKIVSAINVPPFAKALKDGYAIRARDVPAPGTCLLLKSYVPAGRGDVLSLGKDEAVEISTGAPIPQESDSVVMVEDTTLEEGKVCIHSNIRQGQHILAAGTDISSGETVLEAGQMLSPAKIGILAALGINDTIVKKLKVGIISTGNELTEPGNPLGPGRIYDANSYTLSAAIRRLSATPVAYGIVGDDPEKARSLLLEAVSECDVVLTTGSTSAGSDDFMYRLMEEEGQILMHGLKFKPGKPVIIGSVRNIPVIGLPGNPTASLMVFNEIVSSLVRKGLGISAPERQRMKATLMDDVYSDNRLEYHCVEVVDGRAYSVDKTSASITTLAKADGFIVIEPQIAFVKAGNEIEVIFFEN
ncbi:MAG: gephyrin-like molybdotransferase Glp [Methanohalophilus sp.]